ncbi:MAG: TetR/AcrR family transcriptional regulator [Caldilineaceae bacterium]
MPKAFSDHEKEAIRRQLREQGQRLFEIHGLKKTSVDDLTQAAGISKGAFYLFYPSKEELLLDILEQIEAEMQASILHYVVRNDANARQNVRAMLSNFLVMRDDYPLLKNFSQDDFMYLVRKLPAERVQAHSNQDQVFIASFTQKLAQEGITIRTPPRVVTNLIKSLFFVGLHRHELGDDAYQESMAILVDLVAGYVTEGA